MLSLCILFSCTKVVPAELNVTTSDLLFTREGGSQTIDFSTNKDWTATSSESWLKVTPSGISTESSITVVVEANKDYDDRTATITIKVEDLIKTVNVKQSTNLGLILPKNRYELSNEAQSIEIEVQSNVDFEYAIDDASKDWISVQNTKALSSNKIKFDIAQNVAYDKREGKIVFKQKGGSLSETVTVVQSQTDAIIIANESLNFVAKGESHKVKIESNINYSVIVSDEAKSWLSIAEGTKALSTSEITLVANENATSTKRSGLVIVSGADITKEIAVSQEAGKISVDKEEINIGTNGGEISIKVTHNISYTAEISESAKSWIEYNSSKSSDSELWYNISHNDNLDPRTGLITIMNGEFEIPVMIKQAQTDSIYINKDKVEVPLGGGDFTIDIQTNIDVSVEIEASAKEWLKQIQTKAMQASTLSFSVSANAGMTNRKGSITISGNGVQKTIIVEQAGPILVTEISLDQSKVNLFEGSTKTIEATVKPDDATYKTVEWESSNPSVATVNNGEIKAISRGETTITAKCGGFSAICVVTVLGEEDLDLEKDVWIQFTGSSLTIGTGVYYGRGFNIHNDSPVDIDLIEIGTTNFLPIENKLLSGESYEQWLYFNYNVYPKITLRFKYNNKNYEVYLENYAN